MIAHKMCVLLACAVVASLSLFSGAEAKSFRGYFAPVIHMEKHCEHPSECAAYPTDPPHFLRNCKFLKCAADKKCQYKCKPGFPRKAKKGKKGKKNRCRNDDDCADASPGPSGACKELVCQKSMRGKKVRKFGKCVEKQIDNCCVKDADCEQPDDPLCEAFCVGDVTSTQQCAVACEGNLPAGKCNTDDDCSEDDIPAPDRCGLIISEISCVERTCKITAALGPGAVFQECETDKECADALGPPLEFGEFKCNGGQCDQEFNCPVF